VNTNEHEMKALLDTGEALTVEFKSDPKGGLPDRDLVTAVVAMANTEGGLIILSRLRQERRLTTADLVQSTQKSEPATRAALEKLVEAGLVEAQGVGRGRTYILSAKLYKKSGQKAAYIRQAGFEPIQQEQMVLSFIDKHGSIKRADVMGLCRLTGPQAYHLLNRLQKQGKIVKKGERRHAIYTRTS
jgi:ATP-dependent DNA helicase RecG